MNKSEKLTAAEKWTIMVDDLGPFAPVKKLKACLAQAPAGVDPSLVQAIQDNICYQNSMGWA